MLKTGCLTISSFLYWHSRIVPVHLWCSFVFRSCYSTAFISMNFRSETESIWAACAGRTAKGSIWMIWTVGLLIGAALLPYLELLEASHSPCCGLDVSDCPKILTAGTLGGWRYTILPDSFLQSIGFKVQKPCNRSCWIELIHFAISLWVQFPWQLPDCLLISSCEASDASLRSVKNYFIDQTIFLSGL